MILRHVLTKPGSGVCPVTMSGDPGDAEYLAGFLNGHASEVAEDDQLGFDGVFCFKFFQGGIQGNQFIRGHAGGQFK